MSVGAGETVKFRATGQGVEEDNVRSRLGGVRDGLAVGNGIQTVENEQQAWARCNRSDKDKGGGAAKAALALLGLRDQWHV